MKDIIACLALCSALIWVYWQDLLTIKTQWDINPHYSHGYLVPLFAIGLLATRRQAFRRGHWPPSWWGCILLCLGLGIKIFSSYYYVEALCHLSLIISICAIPAIVWGSGGFQWAFPGLAFLIFMIPLPHSLEGALQGPLRTVGTKASTYTLQTMGIPAFSEGHVIVVGQQSVGVAEACSGLNMLMVFFALSTAVALILTHSFLFRTILILSAVPIAIASNVLRIAATAGVYHLFSDRTIFGMPGPEFAHSFFHDWAGWFMMPLGLVMLWIEICILERLVIRVPDRPMVSVGLESQPAMTGDGRAHSAGSHL